MRDAAAASGISKSTVHHLFGAFAVQPRRTRRFKPSADPSLSRKPLILQGFT